MKTVITDLECVCSVVVFVHFKDQTASVGWVLGNTVLSLIVIYSTVEVVLVDALCTRETKSGEEVHDCGIMCRIEGPLHSTLIFGDSFEMVNCFVEVSGGDGSELFLVIEQFDIPVESIHRMEILQCLSIPPEDLQWLHIQMNHAFSIVIVFVNIEESQI